MEAVDKAGDFPQRKGRVCAGNPRRVSCAIEILSFQNFIKVLKTCSAGRKGFFDTLNQTVQQDGPILDCIHSPAFRASSRKHSAVGSGTK